MLLYLKHRAELRAFKRTLFSALGEEDVDRAPAIAKYPHWFWWLFLRREHNLLMAYLKDGGDILVYPRGKVRRWLWFVEGSVFKPWYRLLGRFDDGLVWLLKKEAQWGL